LIVPVPETRCNAGSVAETSGTFGVAKCSASSCSVQEAELAGTPRTGQSPDEWKGPAQNQ